MTDLITTRPQEHAPPAPLDGPPATGRARRWRGGRGWLRRHPIVTTLLILFVAGLAVAGWSYGHALAAPGSDSLGARSVEWVRGHGGASLVNWAERQWYGHHEPPKGGTPTAGAIPAPAPPTPTQQVPQRGPARIPPHLQPPAPVVPLAGPPLAGEGSWRPVGSPVHGLPAVYATAVRPDPVHTSLVTGLAWMDTKLLRAVLYSGSQVPGGAWKDMAPIPADQRLALVAAFNGGFRLPDARGGYYAEGRVIKPLVDGAASLVIRSDGTPTVAKWGRDATLGPDTASVRQNLSLIVDDGAPVAGLQSDSNVAWGATVGNKSFVWRSAVGVTPQGALVYAGGNGLSVESLAEVMAHAGALRAMELDINSAWVNFFSYSPPADVPAAADNGTKLVSDMSSWPGRYFVPSSRDFVGLFAR
ncbi:MAG: phosphodiester glycosidase family protein [Actinobacteria bacterium]|nr:MAG: phosphodiester glycosidase family protein [Actinomycetota bacterium]